jgi:hypothetical protein
VGIPRFVDRALGERVLGVRDQEVRAVVEDLLTEDEIQATLARLHAVQAAIRASADMLVDRLEDWDRARAAATLTDPQADAHSYWARDVMYRAGEGKIDLRIINAPQLRAELAAEPGAEPVAEERGGPAQLPPLPARPGRQPVVMPPLPLTPAEAQAAMPGRSPTRVLAALDRAQKRRVRVDNEMAADALTEIKQWQDAHN